MRDYDICEVGGGGGGGGGGGSRGEVGRPPGERRGGRTRKRRRRRERGGGREGERESGAWGAQVDRCTARSDFKHRATFTAGALKVRPPLRLSSSCVSAFKKAFPAAASAAGERTNHLTPGVLFFSSSSFLLGTEFCARPAEQ